MTADEETAKCRLKSDAMQYITNATAPSQGNSTVNFYVNPKLNN